MSLEKRQVKDRRNKPTKPLTRYSFWGRRKGNRRLGENKNYYVDRYPSKYVLLIISIMLLCVSDAFFTLKILQQGGVELNPIMAVLIQKDPVLFLVVKFSITAVNLIILLVHKNFQLYGNFKLRYLIYFVFFLYFVLILYEIYLYVKLIMN
jgi:hypothetical protein